MAEPVEGELQARERDELGRYVAGHRSTGGRPPGTGVDVSHAFTRALAKDFERHGEATLKRLREDDPASWAAIVARLSIRQLDHSLRRELEFPEGTVHTAWTETLRNFQDDPETIARETEAKVCTKARLAATSEHSKRIADDAEEIVVEAEWEPEMPKSTAPLAAVPKPRARFGSNQLKRK